MTTVIAVGAVAVSVTVIAAHLAAGAPERIQTAADAAPASNGTVSNNGSGATVYGYPGGPAAPDTSLTAEGSLADGTQVSIQCYFTGATVTGPNGLGNGGTDPYWDQIDQASAGLTAQIPAGDAAVVPDAYVQTSTPVNQLVPACASASGAASPLAPGGSSPAASGCKDVNVVFARGTGELQGLGDTGKRFVQVLTSELQGQGKKVQAYAVQFDANYPQTSTIPGANDMENYVTAMAAQCPDTRFVLGGYSQGSAVVDLTLGLGPVLAPIYGTVVSVLGSILSPGISVPAGVVAGTLLAAQPGLPDSLAGRIAAVVTFGNPIHWANQTIATASPVYGPISDDFCIQGDPVCANGTDISAHKQYFTNGMADQGAQFAAGQLSLAG